MASGHVNRIKRPNTWLHRPMLQNVKKALANTEPSTHGTKRTTGLVLGCPLMGEDQKCSVRGRTEVNDPLQTLLGHAKIRLPSGGRS